MPGPNLTITVKKYVHGLNGCSNQEEFIKKIIAAKMKPHGNYVPFIKIRETHRSFQRPLHDVKHTDYTALTHPQQMDCDLDPNL
jgi:hypothetical protein